MLPDGTAEAPELGRTADTAAALDALGATLVEPADVVGTGTIASAFGIVSVVFVADDGSWITEDLRAELETVWSVSTALVDGIVGLAITGTLSTAEVACAIETGVVTAAGTATAVARTSSCCRAGASPDSTLTNAGRDASVVVVSDMAVSDTAVPVCAADAEL